MNRFDAIYASVEAGRPLWDIGCDHGLIGIRALNENRVPFVNFVDESVAVIERLRTKLPPAHFSRSRLWNLQGERLPWEDASGTIVLAGLGIATIQTVIKAIGIRAKSPLRLVMSAEKNSDELRFWLDQRGWRLVPGSEFISLERGRYRLVFAASLSEGPRLSPFGNEVFKSAIGVDYLKSLLVLWRGSQNKRSRWPEHFEELLKLEGQIRGLL